MPTNTSTSLASSANPIFLGQSAVITATVIPVGAAGFWDDTGTWIDANVWVDGSGILPTGTVTFLNGGVSFGSASLSAGQASITFTGTLPVLGSNSLTAVYAGDTNYNGSTSPALNEIVLPLASNQMAAIAIIETGYDY